MSSFLVRKRFTGPSNFKKCLRNGIPPSTVNSECSFILKYINHQNFPIEECETIFKHISAVRHHRDIHSYPTICLYPQSTRTFTWPEGWKIDYTDDDIDENTNELPIGELEGHIEFGETRPKAVEIQFKLKVLVNAHTKTVYIIPRRIRRRNPSFIIIDMFFNLETILTLELTNLDDDDNDDETQLQRINNFLF